jgi:arylsulfatase A-like enzyme
MKTSQRILLGLLFPATATFSAFGQGAALPGEPAFQGTIASTTKDSIPDWPQPVKAPAGAPNIVVILLDDVGFGATGTFGGPAPTPALDKLAATGLKYNRFHTTALCSPTRASLLTGRNPHQSGFGTVTEVSSGYPGYNGYWPKSVTSFPEVLRRHGYNTAAFGKWHNTPQWEISPAGPFDRWPTSRGFEYFYGFLGGEVSQWEPPLYRNTSAVRPSATPEQGYHLTTDLVDDAIRWVDTHESVAPQKPFLLYFATGAAHAPLHVSQEWISKFKGQFDQGWDKIREDIFARQKKLGVIPADAELTPRPAELPAWDSLSSDQKRLLARQAEVYAAFLAHADYEIGRLTDHIRAQPGGDNTAIFYIVGDNGGSAEGGLEGSQRNIASFFLNQPDELKEQLAHIDELGGPQWDNHYATAWGWALNTPFKWTKQIASHLGGVRNPLIVSWPAKIKEKGVLREQFGHVNDIAPTVFEIAGVEAPKEVDGVTQVPIEGKSLASTFTDPKAPSEHHVQYFELGGNRGIYKDGWWGAARHTVPWQFGTATDPAEDKWELYNLESDFSQNKDLAELHPEKLKELQELFDQEAKRNQVYPLSTGLNVGSLFDPTRPSPVKGRSEFVYRAGVPPLLGAAVPPLIGGHTITAQLIIPEQGADGVIVAQGGAQGGYALYVKHGHVVYEHNAFGKVLSTLTSSIPLPKGPVTVTFEFKKEKLSLWGGGTGILSINGKPAGETKIQKVGLAFFDRFEVAGKTSSPTSPEYKVPNTFTGELKEVKISLASTFALGGQTPPASSAQDRKTDRP